MRLILASTSPRRKELLALLGLPFEAVAPPFFEEVTSHGPAEQQALTFAAGKACSCLPLCPDALILGSDTLISLEQEVMGKPVDMADAEAMLRRLAGRPHRIVTAVALVGPGSEVCAVRLATVLVTMKPLNEAALAAYLVTGDSLGKAGAYSIFTAAVGLPLRLVAELLHLRGMSCPVDIAQLYASKPYPNWDRFGA